MPDMPQQPAGNPADKKFLRNIIVLTIGVLIFGGLSIWLTFFPS